MGAAERKPSLARSVWRSSTSLPFMPGATYPVRRTTWVPPLSDPEDVVFSVTVGLLEGVREGVEMTPPPPPPPPPLEEAVVPEEVEPPPEEEPLEVLPEEAEPPEDVPLEVLPEEEEGVGADGVYVQDSVSVGVPPVQPCGEDAVTVRDCVPSVWQAPQALYVKEVQVGVETWVVVPETVYVTVREGRRDAEEFAMLAK